MFSLRKYMYLKILGIVHLIFLCYLPFFCLWSYEDYFLRWSGKVTQSFKLGVSERCLTTRYMFMLWTYSYMYDKNQTNPEYKWLVTPRTDLKWIQGSARDQWIHLGKLSLWPSSHSLHSLCWFCWFPSGSVPGWFGSKHIHTLLNWKPVNTR